MKKFLLMNSLRLLAFAGVVGLGAAENGTTPVTIRGWLSDEQCARGRANGGVYAATNPDCAKQCVAAGAKIVLIDGDHKAILNIANQQAAKQNIGDYVEIQGSIDSSAKVLSIESVTLISKGVAECSRKAKH